MSKAEVYLLDIGDNWILVNNPTHDMIALSYVAIHAKTRTVIKDRYQPSAGYVLPLNYFKEFLAESTPVILK